MISKLKSKKEEGFTIVEVMIVIAIAGLILLIVFLAVPALQRNSRNTQRKNDVSALLGATQEYISNNSGSLPTSAGQITANANLGYYQSTDIDFGTNTNSGSDVNTVYIRTNRKCNGNSMTSTGATSRNIAIQYYIETSSSTAAQCQTN